jgi:hypothetical protein
MISFNFNLANPWSKRWANVWCRAYNTPFKNKHIELEVIKDASIVAFSFKLSHWSDHGGLYIDIGLLGYSVSFNFYDCRHWDYARGQWVSYDDAKESY